MGMIDKLPEPLLALLVVFLLIVIAIGLAMAGVGPFKEILTPTLPQDVLRIGGG